MAATELRHKRLLFLTDLMWIKLSEDKGLPENQVGEITAKSRVQNFMLGPEVGYRFIEQPRLNVDAFTGFRYWHLGSSLEFEPNPLGRKFSMRQNWVDPLLGARLQTPFSPKLRFTLLGDVGGFGAAGGPIFPGSSTKAKGRFRSQHPGLECNRARNLQCVPLIGRSAGELMKILNTDAHLPIG